MCQVIPPSGLSLAPDVYPHQLRGPGHTVLIPTLTRNLGNPNLTFVARVT